MDASLKSPDKSEFSLKTSSAGLTLAFLGVALIIVAVTSKDKYNITEGNMEATLQQKKGQNVSGRPDTSSSRALEDSLWKGTGK